MLPGTLLAGVGHRRGALVHERQRVLEGQRAGGDQRRVLAERVAGRGDRRGGLVGLLGAPGVPRGDRAQEQRRLLEAGALRQALERVVPEQLEPALEQRVVAVRVFHPLRVAALPGEEERDR